MEIEAPQNHNTQTIEANPHQTYTSINVQGITVRANMKQFEEMHALVLFVWGLSTILGVTIPVALIQMKLELGLFPFFIGSAVGYIPLNILVLCYRNTYSKAFIFWSLLTNIALFTLGVLFACQKPHAGMTTLTYCVVQLIVSLITSNNKSLAIIKLLIYFQLVIVAFKLDGMVGVDWGQVLTGLVIMLAFIVMVALLLMVYSVIGGLLSQNNDFFAIRKRGAIFTYLNLLSVCCLMGSGLWSVYVNQNYGYILIAGTLISWSAIIFTFPNIQEITLTFCKFCSLKQKSVPKLEKLQNSQISTLFRVSSNWLVPHQKNALDQNLLSEQCIACMARPANAAWMPCGHCIFCFQCSQSLIKVNPRCGLCKQQPKQILKLTQEGTQLSQKSLSKNEVSVIESYQLKQ